MKYIMVTKWREHWDQIVGKRTFFTKSMFRYPMADSKLVPHTRTIFIKRNKETSRIEGCWEGSVSGFITKRYKDLDAISFHVAITDRLDCPVEYQNYGEGWYCEDESQSDGLSRPHMRAPRINTQDKNKNKDYWIEIEKDLGMSKRAFGKKINFVKSQFKREVIFRDVEHSYVLMKKGFNKPALILAGGVIEELLRLFLEHNNVKLVSNKFVDYVEICEKRGLLKDAVSNLTTALRRFRNLIHLKEEASKKYTISKSTASAAVASIFTIANEF